MYVHIGNSVTLLSQDIIGIFDLDNASTGKDTRAFLRRAEEEGMVIAAGDELPKSMVVCSPRGSWQRVYVSPLGVGALQGRTAAGASAYSV